MRSHTAATPRLTAPTVTSVGSRAAPWEVADVIDPSTTKANPPGIIAHSGQVGSTRPTWRVVVVVVTSTKDRSEHCGVSKRLTLSHCSLQCVSNRSAGGTLSLVVRVVLRADARFFSEGSEKLTQALIITTQSPELHALTC